MPIKKISIMDIFNKSKTSFRSKKNLEPMDEISFFVQISFETYGQVKYLDDSERPIIKEFTGSSWSISYLKRESIKSYLSIFLYNQHYKKEQVLTLTKKLNGDQIEQKSFAIDGEKNYDGWFKIE